MRGKRVNEKILAASLAAVLVLGMLPTAVFGSLELAFPVKAHAASSGTWHGVSYDIDDSGCVTFHAGTMTGNFWDQPFNSYEGFSQVTSVKADGTVVLPENCSGMFHQCSRLVSIDMTHFDSSNATNMSQMFGCGVGKHVNEWVKYSDVSGKHSFWTTYKTFSDLTSLDISSLDTSRVRDMSTMFLGLSSLASLDVSGMDTSKVTNMSSMFDECSSLAFLDVSSFDTSHVEKMSSMFSRCVKLTSLDVSKFNTSRAVGMTGMFSDCLSLTNLDVSHFDTSMVTDMERMFAECESLTTLDVDNFRTSEVTDMSSLFYGCHSLADINVSYFDTSQVKNMSYLFAWCSQLKRLDLSDFDTSSVTDMTGMFDGCTKLEVLDLSHFDTSQVSTMGKSFSVSSAPLAAERKPSIQRDYLFGKCDSLKTVVMGKGFTFCGSGSSRLEGSDFPIGAWKSNANGKTYTASSIPNNIAATYNYVPDPRVALLAKGKTVSLAESVNGKNVTLKVKAIKDGMNKKKRTLRISLRKVMTGKKRAFSTMAREKSYRTDGNLPKTFAIPEPRWHAELRYTIIYAQIAPKGFWKTKNVKTVIAPSTITKIGKRAFGKSSVRMLQLCTRLLSKRRVKDCLQKSKMKTLQVKVAKRWQKKTKKSYKKYFAKKNSGRKVKVA